MPSPWRIASVWRVIRDIDLDGIRDAALERFELWIVADDLTDSIALADLLSGPGERHPWISVFASHNVPGAHSATRGAGALAPVSAVLIVSRNIVLSESLARARQQATETHAPVLTVILGHTGPAASARGENEHARVAVTALDANSLAAISSTLLPLFPDDRRLALGRQLPSLRPALFDGLIQETAQANATFAFTTGLAETMPLLTAPLNVGDVVVLTKNQLMLGYRIVLASGRSGEPRKLIGEIVGVLGGGLLFRQIARQLVGLIPVAGLVPKVAIAYTGTWAIGRAIAAWANEGRTITGDLVRTYSAEAVARGRSFAERLVGEAREGSRRLIRRG
jgi:uncharacterized protein (DUF697 family)